MPDLSEFIYQSTVPGIDVLGAGQVDKDYCERLQRINWPALFGDDPRNPGPFFTKVLTQIKDRSYDYVLIDSRTGLNDQAGICTQVLSDLIVVIFRLTEQNLDGLGYLVPTLKSQLSRRGKDGIQLLPIASQVPSNSSVDLSEKRDRVLEIFKTRRLQYIRFDADLVGDETLLCLKSQHEKRWPTPSIIEDYKAFCKSLRQQNTKDTRTELANLEKKSGMGDTASMLPVIRRLLVRRPRLRALWRIIGKYEEYFERMEQLSDIASFVDEVLERDPANGLAYEWKATQEIRRAIKIGNKDNSDELKDALQNAKTLLQKAVEYIASPILKTRCYRKLVKVASRLGDLESCTAFLRECAKLSPENIQVRLDLVDVQIRRGANYFGSAIDELDSLPKMEDETIKWNLLTYLKSFLGQDAAAAAAFLSYSEQTTHKEMVPLVDAYRHLLAGDRDGAIQIAASGIGAIMDAITTSDSGNENWIEFWIFAGEYDKAIELGDGAEGTAQALLALARFLKGDGATSKEAVIREWEKCGELWCFRELLFAREYTKRQGKKDVGERFGIVEELIQKHALSDPFSPRVSFRHAKQIRFEFMGG